MKKREKKSKKETKTARFDANGLTANGKRLGRPPNMTEVRLTLQRDAATELEKLASGAGVSADVLCRVALVHFLRK